VKPTPDVEITGTATRMNVEPDPVTGGIVLVTYAEMDDGRVGRVWLRIPADALAYFTDRLPAAPTVDPPSPAPCTPACWTPVPCPTCGQDLDPRGRSVALEANPPQCCEDARYSTVNTRHLWSEHDEVRSITDPEGWAAHVADCVDCQDEP
jgi:hypothetical protein